MFFEPQCLEEKRTAAPVPPVNGFKITIDRMKKDYGTFRDIPGTSELEGVAMYKKLPQYILMR